MKESKLYLKFFRENLIYFVIGWLLFGTLGTLYEIQKPSDYRSTQILELPHSSENISQEISQVQEAVTLARSSGVQKQLSVLSKVTVYNNSPLTLVVETSSNLGQNSSVDLNNISWYLTNKFGLTKIGLEVDTLAPPNYLLGVVVGFAIGTIVTLLIVLTKSYMKHF